MPINFVFHSCFIFIFPHEAIKTTNMRALNSTEYGLMHKNMYEFHQLQNRSPLSGHGWPLVPTFDSFPRKRKTLSERFLSEASQLRQGVQTFLTTDKTWRSTFENIVEHTE